MRQNKASNMKHNVKYVENLTLRLLLLSPRVSLYFGDFHPSSSHNRKCLKCRLGSSSHFRFCSLHISSSFTIPRFPKKLLWWKNMICDQGSKMLCVVWETEVLGFERQTG